MLSGLHLLTLDVEQQILSCLFEIEPRLVDPGVRPDLVNCGSLCRVVAEEPENEILKLGGQVFPVDLREVEVLLARHKQIVEVLLRARFLKWEYSVHDDK